MYVTSDHDRIRLFTRRALLVGGLKAGLIALFAGRLYHLQVEEAAKYQTLAEENRISGRLIPPPRGQILDRFGVPLAINQQNFRAILDPAEADDIDILLNRIGAFLPILESDRKRILRDLEQKNTRSQILIQDNLTWDQVAAMEMRRGDFGGLSIEPGEVRSYPYAEATAHILGYVGAPGEKEFKRDPLFAVPGYRIGKSGIELQLDDRLRGQAGRRQLEVDAHGHVVRELARDEPAAGTDIALTIDIGLQQFAQRRLGAERSAAAVVIDAHGGALYALASHPSFDSNLFTFGISEADWNRLNTDSNAPLTNKAVSGLYAPGSTFKTITALAALEAGVTDESDTVYCPGHFDLGDHRFHCWKRGGHGTVGIVAALAQSCDTYFYDLSLRVGIDKIQAMARRMGLGARTEIDLPHERSGLVPGRSWKLATYKQEWQQGETLINGIGQGYMLATPLQLAVMAARLANGGLGVGPYIVRDAPQEKASSLGIAARHIEIVSRAMNAVVNSQRGTAYSARIADPAMAMAGKTGTSQVRRISKSERETGVIANEKRAWEDRDHALFVGFAPVAAPRYAVAVVVEHGGGGSHVAAPIARDILVECQKRNPARA
ncbi:MAG: penicillin-binding protein 2 [Alphaproteobacteria bacterium]